METFYAVDINNNYFTNIEIPKDEKSREDIILILMEHLNGSGRNIITDDNNTSYFLSEKLKDNNLQLTGSLSKNHEDIPDFLKSNSSCHVKDTTLFYTSNEKLILTTLKFENDEIVHFHEAKINCFQKLKRMIDKYTVIQKSKRWPLAIFYTIIDIAAFNAYSIYKYTDASFERRQFLLDLAKELAEGHIARRLSSDEKIYSAVAILGLKHLLTKRMAIKGDEIFEMRKIKQTMTRKRGRCFNCPRSMDRKSSEKCDKCFSFVCTEHRGVLCVMCFKKEKNFEENDDN